MEPVWHRKLLGTGAILLIALFGLCAEEGRISLALSVAPDISFPMGDNADYYKTGYGARLSGLGVLSEHAWISPRVDFSYNYLPVDLSEPTALSLLRASAGPQVTAVFGERLTLYGYATAGGYYGSLQGAASAQDTQFSLHGGVGSGFQLFPDVSLLIGAEYDRFLGTYDAFGLFAGVTTRLSGSGGGAVPLRILRSTGTSNLPASGNIRIDQVELSTVFPVLRKYYDSAPIGSARVQNRSQKTMEDLEVRLVPSAYIDSPKLSTRIEKLLPGETRTIDLYVLFNEEILNVSEGARVVTDVQVKYSLEGRPGVDSETVTLKAYDRNALLWDDDTKIAAFVTAKDDEVQRFAKNIASLGAEAEIVAVNDQLRQGMLQFTALKNQGVTYVVDPSSSYEVLSENPVSIDYVQFPRQTLYVRAGDCDDLSAAYCALLESVGVRTAFITVPGHIYTAFRLELDEQTARREFAFADDLIFREDETVWLPVEITMLKEGFLRAWAEGAREWRTNMDRRQAEFFTTGDAWKRYQPVAFSVSTIELGMPERNKVLDEYRGELRKYMEKEIYPREQRLLARLRERPGDAGARNALGVLYGRYGRFTEAREQFEEILRSRNYLPAFINLGNIDYLEGNYPEAVARYQAVLQMHEQNTAALLGLARAEHERENFRSAKAAYSRLARFDSQLAARYAYLNPEAGASDESRAADARRLRVSVEWEEM
jgi:tetratricopeptide (TPR) repeat protein